MNFKKTLALIGSFAILLAMTVAISYASAARPSGSPSSGTNAPKPVHVGAEDQVKMGALALDSLAVGLTNVLEIDAAGRVGLGKTPSNRTLDVAGAVRLESLADEDADDLREVCVNNDGDIILCGEDAVVNTSIFYYKPSGGSATNPYSGLNQGVTDSQVQTFTVGSDVEILSIEAWGGGSSGGQEQGGPGNVGGKQVTYPAPGESSYVFVKHENYPSQANTALLSAGGGTLTSGGSGSTANGQTGSAGQGGYNNATFACQPNSRGGKGGSSGGYGGSGGAGAVPGGSSLYGEAGSEFGGGGGGGLRDELCSAVYAGGNGGGYSRVSFSGSSQPSSGTVYHIIVGGGGGSSGLNGRGKGGDGGVIVTWRKK